MTSKLHYTKVYISLHNIHILCLCRCSHHHEENKNVDLMALNLVFGIVFIFDLNFIDWLKGWGITNSKCIHFSDIIFLLNVPKFLNENPDCKKRLLRIEFFYLCSNGVHSSRAACMLANSKMCWTLHCIKFHVRKLFSAKRFVRLFWQITWILHTERTDKWIKTLKKWA